VTVSTFKNITANGDAYENRRYLWDTFIICLSIYLSIYGCTALVDLGGFSVPESYTQSVGLLGRGMSPSQGRYLHIVQHKQNKRTETSMPRVGFEPTISVFERVKMVHVLDRSAGHCDRHRILPECSDQGAWDRQVM
jgi:hypothetical protein